MSQLVKALLLPCFLLLLGCTHIPPGAAKKASISFGVPMVFSVNKTISNVKVDEQKIAVGDTATKITIFAFQWDSFAEGLTLSNPTR